MDKLDLRKEYKHLYAPSPKKVELVKVPKFNFARLDGVIQPGETVANSPAFQEAIGALYGVSYTLKFMSKQRARNPIDYPVMPHEGLWWNQSGEFGPDRQEEMFWTLMIFQPKHITAKMFQEAVQQLCEKRDNPALARVRLEPFAEGLSVQTLHIGPYATETATIERMREFARENGYVPSGKHHEIYLGDPSRSKPEKLRTALRLPVKKG